MLNVTLLGRFSAANGARHILLHDGSKAQELFVYLLLKRQQAHTREEIASVLWEDSAPSRSKAYLRKALWQLQTALKSPSGIGTQAPVLEVNGEWLRLHPEAAIWLDVAVLESAYSDARGLEGTSLQRSTAVAFRDAVALYTGDLLPNRYQHWCLEERERLKHLYLCMLEKLLEFSEAQGEYEAGLSYAYGILAHDSTREHIHRQVMRLHCLRGDRASAVRQYGQCVEVLAEELGIPPMRETTALFEQLHEGSGDAPRPLDFIPLAAASLQEVLQRIENLEAVLGQLRRSVDRAVRSRESPGG